MKKKILFVTALFAGSLAFAQGTTTSVKNKRGMEYLPQAGDWAIQFDAAPVLNFVGRSFSGAANSPTASSPFTNPSSPVNTAFFVGKKFTSATEAYRVKVGITFNRMALENTQVTPSGTEYITTTNTNTTNIVLGFGKEWRRGHNRLQGFYGIEGLVQIGSFTPVVSREYSMDLEMASDSGFVSPSAPSTVVNRSNGVSKSTSFGVGARGFIGVEYFVAPKISIGGEFGWGLGYMTQSGEREDESFDTANPGDGVTTTTTKGNKNSGFSVGNDNGGSIFGGSASLNLTFHF